MNNQKISVRPAVAGDLTEIANIYDQARAFMRTYGNMTQWPTPQYPSLESAKADLEDGILYVVEHDQGIAGTFVLVDGPDPTYGYIENGAWRQDTPYAAVHRVASVGGGVMQAALAFSRERYAHLRMDTHADNAPMRHQLEKYGFSHRGTIYVGDGTPRMAFDWLEEEHGTNQ